MDKKTKMKEKKASGIWKKVLNNCFRIFPLIFPTFSFSAKKSNAINFGSG